jgi:hypothetical protein
MAKAPVKAKPAPEPPVYDVAISFLVADEKIASAIKTRLAGLNVFFYPHNQEDLIGTNGLESMRAPFLSARVNVVLYRERYGKTPWTGVELAAIQDSCLKTGFRSLLFVQLEKKDGKPEWLPDTHIRCVLGDFTIDQLVGAIKSKVQERGGVIHRPDAMSEAERVKREAEYIADRDAMMRDRAWIEGTVHRSLREAFKKVGELVAQANKDHGFAITCGANGYQSCVMRSGFVSLGCGWQQPIFNKVGSDPHGDCYLRVAEFSGTLLLPGERGWVMQEPSLVKEHRIKVGVSENGELVWLDGKEQIEPERLADYIVMILMDLISRANQGKVERPQLPQP